MSEKIDQIIEDLKTLTLLEASELVSKIEETFNVDASASGGATMVMAGPAVTEEDRKSTRLELQSHSDLVCRLLLEKKKNKKKTR